MSGWTGDRGNRILVGITVLALVWLALASRIHVNASWSDDAWGYFLVPMATPGRGDVVVFDPPESLGAAAPYLKTVRGVPGDIVSVDVERGVWVGEEYLGRAKPVSLTGRELQGDRPRRGARGPVLPSRRSRGQPRQPLRGDRAGAGRSHPGTRHRPARHPLARP